MRPLLLVRWRIAPFFPLLSALCLGVGTLAPFASADTVLYVSNEIGTAPPDGSPRSPFHSLEEARDAIRKLRAMQRLDGPVRVLIHGGTYYLSKTLVFTPEDSGTISSLVSYEGVAGEVARLDGGRPIRGWHRQNAHIWYADVPDARNGHWKFLQLFVDGKRAIPARYPNSGWITLVADGDRNTIRVAPGTLKPSWANERNALVNIIAEKNWFNELVQISSISADGSQMKVSGRECQGLLLKGNRFFVEGIKEELDSPGEWYLDSVVGRLYYWPLNKDPNQSAISAPVVDRLVEFRGDHDGHRNVEYIALKNLTLTDADYTVGHVSVRTAQDAAVRLVNASHCSIELCHIYNVGGYGVWLHLQSWYNRISSNEITENGAGGVLLTSARFSYANDDNIYDPDPAVQDFAPLRNQIDHNEIHDTGKIRYYTSGVHLDSRPEKTAFEVGNQISHNDIHDVPRLGIFAFRNQGGNIIEYNLIHHTMQSPVVDGGGIHIAIMNALAAPLVIYNNVIHDVGVSTSEMCRGIYLDWYTSNARVENNLVYNTVEGTFYALGGDNLTVVNNIFANDPQGPLVFGFWNTRTIKNAEFERNIVVQNIANAPVVRIFAGRYIALEELAHNTPVLAQFKNNIYFNYSGSTWFHIAGGTRFRNSTDYVLSFAEWVRSGSGSGSIVSDPLFVDSAHGDYHLRNNSPAARIGFKPISFQGVGSKSSAHSAFSLESLARQGIIIAFQDSCCVKVTGTWHEATPILSGQSHTFFHYLEDGNQGKGQKSVQFTAHLPAPGSYRVYARWMTDDDERASNVPISIEAGDTKATVSVDQRKNANKWLLLGTYKISHPDKASVTISNAGTKGTVVADAIAFVRE